MTEKSLPKLTPEEEALPYAKYYYKPLPAPFLDPCCIERPMDAKNAVIDDLNDLLNLSGAQVENGYCQPDQGGGYVAITTQMPGVTLEMYRWWKNWRETGEDLRYKIWYPGCHLRYQGNLTNGWEWIQEDIGNGVEDIYSVRLMDERDVFDPERYAASDFVMVHAANTISRPAGGDLAARPFPIFICHMLREIPDGLEIRSRFWQGYHLVDKKLFPYFRPEVKAPLESIHALALHCLTEYANLREIIPALYSDLASG